MNGPSPHPSGAKQGVPFGRYLIRARLGGGGMGEVFLADQLGPLGPVRPVALKRMLPRFARDETVLRLFLEEMAIAAQLNHPNIATTYDFGEVDGAFFLAMEYVEGLSLQALIAQLGPLPVPGALAIARGVAEALAYAHALKVPGRDLAAVVHCDVSPHNVMISTSGGVKLLDFGVARAEAVAHKVGVFGKPGYAAPEQLRGAPPDRGFDLWSLGVVLYEMLAGVRPFRGASVAEIVAAAESAPPRPLAEIRPEAALVAGVIAEALQPDPARRTRDARAMADACQALEETFDGVARARLAALIDRAGGARAPAMALGDLTGTGVAALGPGGAVLPASAPARTEPEVAGLDAPTHTGVAVFVRPDRAAAGRPGRRPGDAGPAGDTRDGGSAGPERTASQRWILAAVLLASAISGAAAFFIWGAAPSAPGARPRPPGADGPAPPGLATGDTGGTGHLQGEVSRLPQTAPAPAAPAPADRAPAPADRAPAPADRAPAPADRAPAPADTAADAASRASRPARGSSGSRERPEPPDGERSRKHPHRSKPRDRGSEASEGGLGVLSVRTVPWARVTLDGQLLGDGIIADKPVAAGKHRLTLRPGDAAFPERTIAIEIRIGVVTKVFVDFRSGSVRVAPM